VYANLAGVLAEAGCTLRDVVKFTTYTVQSEDGVSFTEWRKAEYPRLFPDGVYPANTGVVVKALARPGLLLEVEAVAVRPDASAPWSGRPRARAAGRRQGGAGGSARRRRSGRRR
jgi:enamine deaminase RidA (YjgF/YER057c/UK114 family)